MNVITQQLCEGKHKQSFSTLIKQLKQQNGLVQIFTNKIIEKVIEQYPKYVTDDVLDVLSNEYLKSFSLKGCTNVSLISLERVMKR